MEPIDFFVPFSLDTIGLLAGEFGFFAGRLCIGFSSIGLVTRIRRVTMGRLRVGFRSRASESCVAGMSLRILGTL